MAKWQYTKGLHDLGNGCFAYRLSEAGNRNDLQRNCRTQWQLGF